LRKKRLIAGLVVFGPEAVSRKGVRNGVSLAGK
jgi:hypothetical protein